MALITEVFVYVVTESEGEEGIPAISLDGAIMPMLAADPKVVQKFRRYALSIAKEMGKPVKLVRFSTMEVVEEFEP